MRTIASGLLSALRGEKPDVVALFELSTGIVSPSIERWAHYDDPVTWNGSAYPVRPTEISDEIRHDSQGESQGVTLHVANADARFEALIASGADFRRRRCTIRVTESTRLSASPAEAISEIYFVETWTFTHGLFTLELLPRFALLDVRVPRGVLTRAEFPGIPRDISGL